MLSSLFSSASALSASQTLLNVVGNNLANSNTVGFKAQHVEFATQFTQTLQAASAPSSGSGGTNPIQIGNGVQVGATSTNLTQGTFESTGNPYDLAIQGSGFFVVWSILRPVIESNERGPSGKRLQLRLRSKCPESVTFVSPWE
jgi:flagellar hook protein FlgE